MQTYFILQDLETVLAFMGPLVVIFGFSPDLLGHPDNYIPANPLSTPTSI